MKGIAVILTTATALTLGACASDPLSPVNMQRAKAAREAHGIYNYIRLFPETEEVEFTYGSTALRRMPVSEFERFVSDQLIGSTVVVLGGDHGTQIEAFRADGKIALWYPGNDRAVIGRVRFQQSFEPWNAWGDRAGVLICFTYEASYNPSTGAGAGREECTSAYAFIASIAGKRQGDPFRLLNGSVPSVIGRDSRPPWPDGTPLVSERAPHA